MRQRYKFFLILAVNTYFLCTFAPNKMHFMEKELNYLDRNEFNFEPSQKVVDAIHNFDPKTLCFYTRIYDQGKKSVVSVRLSEIYNVPEEQVLLDMVARIS